MVQRAVLVTVQTVWIGGRRLDRRDRRDTLIIAAAVNAAAAASTSASSPTTSSTATDGARIDRAGLDLAAARTRVEDRRRGHAVLARRRRALGLSFGRAAARRRG